MKEHRRAFLRPLTLARPNTQTEASFHFAAGYGHRLSCETAEQDGYHKGKRELPSLSSPALRQHPPAPAAQLRQIKVD